MSDIAISADSIGKQFNIGKTRGQYRTFREIIVDSFSSPVRKAAYILRGGAYGAAGLDKKIWALKGVSFEINRGDAVGIIGKNGSGKSTLLKILSRITEPTEGRAWIKGRVGSLLEVGTGFHLELTGRENIFLNGAILGMKRWEIRSKFDEIVSFAEVEEFIDTPVKHYSTGMYLRLAFAVAAHLEPEILLVDEVLSVGDAAFQKKCLGKMEDVGQEGRTVLFVSHNMPAVTRLCRKAVLLDDGNLVSEGPAQKVVSEYLNSGRETLSAITWRDPLKAPGDDIVRLRATRVKTEDGRVTDRIDIRKRFIVEMEYEVLKPGYAFMPNFRFYNGDGLCLFITLDTDPAWRRRKRPAGRYVSSVYVPGNYLAEGMIYVTASMKTRGSIFKNHFHEPDAVAFHVVDAMDGNSAKGDWPCDMGGVVRPLLEWRTRSAAPESCQIESTQKT